MIRFLGLFLLLMALVACSSPDQPTLSFYTTIERADLNQLKRHIYWKTDLNQQFSNGDTALHIAVRKGNPVFVELLLKNNVDIDIKNDSGHTPLETALLNSRTRIADQLILKGAKFEANALLAKMVENKITNRDVYRFLNKLGAQPSKTSIGKSSLINYAITNNQRLLVKRLITIGADVNAKDENGELPLALAELSPEPEIKTLLIQNGAELPHMKK